MLDETESKVILEKILQNVDKRKLASLSNELSLKLREEFPPLPELNETFSSLLAIWGKLLQIYGDISAHQYQKSKFDDYFGRFESEINRLTDEMETVKIRHQELLKKVRLVVSVFDEKMKDEHLLDLLKLLKIVVSNPLINEEDHASPEELLDV